MSDILDKLHGDHIRIAQLLDLLESQLDLLRHPQGEGAADHGLMRDIARYFVTFPDHGHHAIEDRLFSAMETASPALKNRFAALRTDHESLGSLGEKFYAMLDAVCAGQIVERQALVDAVQEFLDLQRQHMNTEESDIFPHARACLDGTDIAAIEAEHAALDDPLFGAEMDDYFARLHETIVARTR